MMKNIRLFLMSPTIALKTSMQAFIFKMEQNAQICLRLLVASRIVRPPIQVFYLKTEDVLHLRVVLYEFT